MIPYCPHTLFLFFSFSFSLLKFRTFSSGHRTHPMTLKYPSKMPATIFLDSGGVINDNSLRAPQWLRYLGEFLPTTVLGGTAQVWSAANIEVVKPFFSRWHEYMTQAIELAAQVQAEAIAAGQDRGTVERGLDKATNVYWIFERVQLLIWIKEMCRVAGPHHPELESKILPSLTDDDLHQVAKSAQVYAIERVKAAYPGAIDTLRNLKASQGYKIYTSSGDSYEDLVAIMKGLDVIECFDDMYGSDRVNCLKASRLYYDRIFERVGLRVVRRDASGRVMEDPEEGEGGRDEVVVLDDSIKALQWAREAGARTILITDKELDLSLEAYSHIDYKLKALTELPALLESWRTRLEIEGARS
ncbi:MAG: hypothetical protein J3Q66DRAFT_327440 [Benniella sp.]|nr:MAG: hypothetical protein J3Q66DRAFT_327440 [Benniella sp.]